MTGQPSSSGKPPLARVSANGIEVRGRDVAGELIGRFSFTEMLLLELDGEAASAAKAHVVDAVLVAMMEHGVTPSSLTTRLVLDGAPESLQGAVAAGLLATGSRFLGVIEQAAALLEEVAGSASPPGEAAVAAVARLREAGERVPGFGHYIHRSADPRVAALIGLAREEGLAGAHVRALEAVAEQVAPIPPNAAGAIGAVLCDAGYPSDGLRGFALVARCAGLFAHALEERRSPTVRRTWTTLEDALGEQGDGSG